MYETLEPKNAYRTMFERLTQKSLRVIELAQQETRSEGHAFVGSEQILIGLILERTGIAAQVLRACEVDLEDVRRETQKIIGVGSGSPAEFSFTIRGKRILELAWEESRSLGHTAIGTEHLLLALVKESDCVAYLVLQELNVDLKSVVSKLMDKVA